MAPPNDTGGGDDGALTRRGYLAAAGASVAGAGAVGLTGSAAAQGNRIRRRVVIPGAEDRFEDYNQDLFMHVIESTQTRLDTKEFEKCEFSNWDPESTTAYRTQLIDSLEENPEPVETNAFVNQSAAEAEKALQPGSLYIVDQQHPCPGRYVGLEVEFLTGRTPSVEEGQDATATSPATSSPSPTDTSQPGFGALSALGTLGALGAGALARAWRRE